MDAILSLQDLSVAAGNVGDAGQLEQNAAISSLSFFCLCPRADTSEQVRGIGFRNPGGLPKAQYRFIMERIHTSQSCIHR